MLCVGKLVEIDDAVKKGFIRKKNKIWLFLAMLTKTLFLFQLLLGKGFERNSFWICIVTN